MRLTQYSVFPCARPHSLPPQALNDMLVYCLQQRVMAASGLFPTHRAEQQHTLQRTGRLGADATRMLSQLRHSVCSVPALTTARSAGHAVGMGVPNVELLSHLLFPQSRWAPVPESLLKLLTPQDKAVCWINLRC